MYIQNSLSPSPQVGFTFKSAVDNLANGSDFIHNIFGTNVALRHKKMKAFLHAVIQLFPSLHVNNNQTSRLVHSFWYAIYVSKLAVYLGKHIYGNEQTIGYQGCHPDILRINYKKEGNRFQYDCIWRDGYTYSFYFRNQTAPKILIDTRFLPLHARI